MIAVDSPAGRQVSGKKPLCFLAAVVPGVIRRYSDCGNLHFGFVRLKCEDCS
jgi:hypothetical protein